MAPSSDQLLALTREQINDGAPVENDVAGALIGLPIGDEEGAFVGFSVCSLFGLCMGLRGALVSLSVRKGIVGALLGFPVGSDKGEMVGLSVEKDVNGALVGLHVSGEDGSFVKPMVGMMLSAHLMDFQSALTMGHLSVWFDGRGRL